MFLWRNQHLLLKTCQTEICWEVNSRFMKCLFVIQKPSSEPFQHLRKKLLRFLQTKCYIHHSVGITMLLQQEQPLDALVLGWFLVFCCVVSKCLRCLLNDCLSSTPLSPSKTLSKETPSGEPESPRSPWCRSGCHRCSAPASHANSKRLNFTAQLKKVQKSTPKCWSIQNRCFTL